LFFEFKKNSLVKVNLYQFEGITCSGCMNTVTKKFTEIKEVLNVSMNSNFTEIIIVSTIETPLEDLQKIVSYDENYKIIKITQ
jgi:copper chaperone CopZ